MDQKTLNQLNMEMSGIIYRHLDVSSKQWLDENILQTQSGITTEQLSITFSLIQRKIPKSIVKVTEEDQERINYLYPGFSFRHWSLQRLCRVWLIMHLNPSQKETYINTIEYVFKNAEMNELVALYSSLPVLVYPEEWRMRCAEGIRNNIAIVLEAIMHNNPYPSAYLSESAWNQMVLKAFFTEKDIDKIVGLKDRSNQLLANTLSDYAQELIAAGRPVNEKLWPLVQQSQKY